MAVVSKIRLARDYRAALIALLVGGCGGNATDGGDSEPTASGTGGTVISDPEDPGEGDPLLDENFDAALEEALRESCRLQIECFGTTQWGAEDECTLFFDEVVRATFNVQSRDCRAAVLDTYECFNETWSCDEGGAGCDVGGFTGCFLELNGD